MFCENCGAPIEAGQAFCMSCGAKVNAAPAAEAVAPVAQPVAEAVAEAEPVAEAVAQPVVEAAAPVAEAVQPVAEAVAAPVAEAVQPAAEAVAAPVAEAAQPVQQAQPVAAAPAASGKNGFAIAGLILGIVTMVFCWVPILVWVLGGTGLALSIVGLVKSKVKGGKGQSITGLVLSAVGAVIGVFVIIIWGSAMYINNARRAADSVRRHNADIEDYADELEEELENAFDWDI